MLRLDFIDRGRAGRVLPLAILSRSLGVRDCSDPKGVFCPEDVFRKIRISTGLPAVRLASDGNGDRP